MKAAAAGVVSLPLNGMDTGGKVPDDADRIRPKPFKDRSLGQLNIISTLLSVLISISVQFESLSPAEKYTHDTSIAGQLISAINQNLFSDISLSSISRQFYISESQVNRIFKRATGASVWKYIRAKRLLAAREMILAGTPATAAAENCGFQDYSTFYRAYVAQFHILPSETLADQELP